MGFHAHAGSAGDPEGITGLFLFLLTIAAYTDESGEANLNLTDG